MMDMLGFGGLFQMSVGPRKKRSPPGFTGDSLSGSPERADIFTGGRSEL